MAEIKLEHVFKIYPNGAKAVDDFNLDIKDKEFVVFVGPSGCGKSTTLRMIAGLEEITGGKCYIGNKLVNFVQPKDRDIGMVFQNYALYPNMSVYSNLAFGLKMRKFPEPVLDESGNPIYEIDKKRISKEQNRVAYFDKKILDYENKTKEFTPEYMSQIQKEKDEIKTELDAMDKQKAKIIERKGDSKKLKALKKQYYNAEKRVAMARLQGANNSADAPVDPEIEYLKQKINELENQAILENPKFDQKKYNALVKKFNKLNAITYAFKDLEVINAMKEERENALKAINYYSSTPVEKVVYKKKSKAYIHETIDEAAKILEIEEYLARKPKALSGGQRQRVAIGRAIVRHPKVFLMDEPLSNLDAKLRVQMRQEIIRIHKKVGATTIYVTHDQTEAMTMADRIVVMKLGVIQQIGEPRYLYNHPANLFVASFIGTPTINVTRLPYHDGAITFAKGHDIKLNAEQVKALKGYTDKRLLVGIRPEDIIFNKKGKFEGKINIVEAVGSEKLIHFKTGDFELTAKAKNYLDVKEDSVVNFDINFDNIHVFDKNEKCIF